MCCSLFYLNKIYLKIKKIYKQILKISLFPKKCLKQDKQIENQNLN